jgi:hypothetical protein
LTRHLSKTESIPLDAAQLRLATIWLTGSAIVVLLVVVQSLMNHFEGKSQDAWEWLLPTISPTLGMIVASLGYTALDPLRSETVVRKSFYRISMGTSVFYISLVLLTILVAPFTGTPPINLMHASNLWLGPIQGLVASALSVLFVSKQKKEGQADHPSDDNKFRV